MTLYKQYKKLNLDTSVLGLNQGKQKSDYICTPIGARIFAWESVDGIHYCFLRGFGEMVFAVDPTETDGNQVHPLANTFHDFLRLLLYCGSTSAIQQIYGWSQSQFQQYLRENPPTEEQHKVIEQLATVFALTPMEHPYAYVKKLQAAFDYGNLHFRKAYYERKQTSKKTASKIHEWAVYFSGNFWGHSKKWERPSIEIPTGKSFSWGEENWRIPAVYSGSAGLVVDFCVEIDPERIRTFVDKWSLLSREEESYTEEEQTQIESENPLRISIRPRAFLNGKELWFDHSCAVSWNPCHPDKIECETEAKAVREHYACDPSKGWVFIRTSFQWATKRKPAIRELHLTLEPEPTCIPGIHFTLNSPGQKVTFAHPVTGIQHTLTEIAQKQNRLSCCLRDRDLDWPDCYTQLQYTLVPDLQDKEFMVQDCIKSDPPRVRPAKPFQRELSNDSKPATIGIIGGSDGPTAIFLTGKKEENVHMGYSSLHFEPAEAVEWKMVFHEKLRETIAIKIV